MATAAQITANTANAEYSSGPRTETGKAVSSRNALKHGLTAQTVLLPGEDEAAYLTMCAGMFETFSPGSEPERSLIQILCDAQWRIRRCSRLEAAILSEESLDLKALDIVSKHEVRLTRIYTNTLQQARDLIDVRLSADQARLNQAIRIRRADQLEGRATDFQEIGFVFSTAQVDAAIRREDLLARAGAAIAQSKMTPKKGR